MIEHVVYASDARRLATLADGFDRLYFGVEFCELALPSVKDVARAKRHADERSMGFTLVTPYVTDAGLDGVGRLIGAMAESGPAEVVVNDYGTLSVLRRFPSLTPVFGRLLTRQKRGFGISAKARSVPDMLADHFRRSNVDAEPVALFLREYGIGRVELDNLIQGVDVDLAGAGLKGSLYTPYGYITTTRACPYSFDGRGWKSMTGECGKACRSDLLLLDGDIVTQTIYMRGNTQFFKKTEVPDDRVLEDMGINRIVFEIEIPM